jgi:hypothetical protein
MKISRIIKYLFTAIGLGMLIGSFFLYQNTAGFIENASIAQGIVVNLEPSRSSDSTTYRPVVQFTTQTGEKIEFASAASSNPPAYSKGEHVEVLYLAAKPQEARINGYFSLWGGATIVGALGGIFFLVGAGIIVASLLKNRSDIYLKQNGVPIQTKYQSTEINSSLKVNGRSPFRIITQWQNPATSRLHIFKSDNLWFNPEDYIKKDSITVFIKKRNPKKYYVDLSFLPKLAE